MQSDSGHTLISDFREDFKAEIIAAEISEQGTDIEQILILMLGSLKRTFSNDVNMVETELSEDHKEYVVVKAAREGIYDMLPEGLFHHPTAHKSARTEKEIIDMMKRRRQEEISARKFFVPFEATINHLRIRMALHENRLDKRSHYDDLVELFKDHWEIFQYLNARQANIFLHLIPIIHDIRDDHGRIEQVMEMIFSSRVIIHMRRQKPLQPADAMPSRVAEGILGVDLTTGNICFNEGVDEIVVSMGPMDAGMHRDFIPGGRSRKIYDLLCDYLLPVHADVVSEFELIKKQQRARLADEHSDFNSRLGQDMVLYSLLETLEE